MRRPNHSGNFGLFIDYHHNRYILFSDDLCEKIGFEKSGAGAGEKIQSLKCSSFRLEDLCSDVQYPLAKFICNPSSREVNEDSWGSLATRLAE